MFLLSNVIYMHACTYCSVFFNLQLSVMGDKKFDNPQSANLTRILEDCELLQICMDQINQAKMNNNVEGADATSRFSSSTSTTTSVNYIILTE